MITLFKKGNYRLIETKHGIKNLSLGNNSYAWVDIAGIGEVLVVSHKPHKTDHVLCTGRFRLYDVDDEPKLSDQAHLELEVGRNQWQGYLLLTGLPAGQKIRGRIIPTFEIITGRYDPVARHKLAVVDGNR
jgi:hypothetical protein